LRNSYAFTIVVYFIKFQTVNHSDLTGGLSQREKLSWSGPTSQHSEKFFRDDGESRFGWL